jgi:hypothetical protein
MNQESKLIKSKLGLLNLAPTEPKTLKISAESGKVPSPSLSANQMNGPALPGIFVGADGTSLLGPDEETKMGVSVANSHSFE